jgi:hypothetical protein
MSFGARGMIYTVGAGVVLFGFGWVIRDDAASTRIIHPRYWIAIGGGFLVRFARYARR